MKVWIDQDLCTGDGLCEEICPSVFTLLDDGLAYVKQGDDVLSSPGGAEGLAVVPAGMEDAVVEASEECPGECIFIEKRLVSPSPRLTRRRARREETGVGDHAVVGPHGASVDVPGPSKHLDGLLHAEGVLAQRLAQ